MKMLTSVLVLFGLSTFIFSSQTRSDFVNNLAQVAGITPAPTASLTANGQSSVTAYVGQTVDWKWSSTNADGGSSTYTSTCEAPGEKPWNKTGTGGSMTSAVFSDAQANCSYVLKYTATQGPNGPKAESSVTLNVLPRSAMPPTASLLVNGQKEATVTEGGTVEYTWSSTNADTYTSEYVNGCTGAKTGWNKNSQSGTSTSNAFASNLVGCTITFTYKASQGGTTKSAESVITVKVLPKVTAVPTVAPTATLTVNGQTNLEAHVGDSVGFTWSSTNADTFSVTTVANQPTCAPTPSLGITTASGSLRAPAYSVGHTNCTYTYIYTASQRSTGQRAVATTSVWVRPNKLVTPEPTAFLLADGKNIVNYYVGDTAKWTWGSTNADIASSTYTSTCESKGEKPWNKNTLNGSMTSALFSTPQLNCTYVLKFLAIQNSTGKIASSSVLLNVVPKAITTNNAPVLKSFSSTNSSGTYVVGSQINITATFDHKVTSGSMKVRLNSGADVVLDQFHNDSTLTGTYTVKQGESTYSLNEDVSLLDLGIDSSYFATNKLNLYVTGISLISVTDANGSNQSSMTLPSINIDSSKSIVVDGSTSSDIGYDNTETTVAEAQRVMDSVGFVNGGQYGYGSTASEPFVEWQDDISTNSGSNSILASISKIIASIFNKTIKGQRTIELVDSNLMETHLYVSFENPHPDDGQADCHTGSSIPYVLDTTNLHNTNGNMVNNGASENFGPFDGPVSYTFEGDISGNELTINGKTVVNKGVNTCFKPNHVLYSGTIPKGGTLSLGMKQGNTGWANFAGDLTIKNTWMKEGIKDLMSRVGTAINEDGYVYVSYPYGVKKIYPSTKATDGSVSFDWKKVTSDASKYGGSNFLLTWIHMHTRYYTNPSMDKLAGVIGNPPSISFIRKNFYTKAFSGDYYVTARLNKEYKNSYINGFVVDVSKNIWWFGVPNQDSIDKAKNLLKSVPLMNKDGDFDWVKLVKKIYIPAGLPLGKTSLRSFDEGNYDTQIIKY